MYQLSRFKTRHVALFCVILSLTVVETTHADTVRYKVEPVALSYDYAITGGFIETNGTLGPLAERDITDYRIDVAGLLPYVFQPSNPGPQVFIQGDLLASVETITISQIEDGQTPLNGFGFLARDNEDDRCDVEIAFGCVQKILWSGNSRIVSVSYTYSDINSPDGDPNEFGAWVFQNSETVVIATVPEPSTAILLLFGLACLVACAWRRRRRLVYS